MTPRAGLVLALTAAWPILGAAPSGHVGRPAGPAAAPVALVGVDVLSISGASPAEILRDQVVIVRDGRIARLGPRADVAVPDDVARIVGEGRIVMPGLVDAHAHAGAESLPLYVANGVTTVRLMHGDAERLGWRDRQRSEAVPWPNLIVGGPLVAGHEVPWPHVLVTGTGDAAAEVERQAASGYDFVKVYDGLTRRAYDAVAARARDLDLPFAGHVPIDVGLRHVLEAGQATIEHAEQLLYATFGRDGVMTLPLERVDEVVRIFEAARGGPPCVTPTLRGMTLAMRRGTPYTDSLFEAPRMAYADPSLGDWWSGYRAAAPAEARERREHFLAFQQRVTAAVHRAGVPLLTGTDTPYPLLVPGFSLHEEIEALVEAGLPRKAALAAATRNAGRCLPGGERFGVVEEGARADLLLLDGDPLEDPGALGRPAGVMVRGRWYDRAALDVLLERVREQLGSPGSFGYPEVELRVFAP